MTTLHDQWGLPIEHELERAVRRMVESRKEPRMTQFLRVDTDGNCTLLEIAEGDLAALQTAVGGDIEAVHLNGGMQLYIDEEGKFKDLEPNLVARLLVGTSGTRLLPGDQIVGPILIYAGIDDDGNEISVNPETVSWLRNSKLTRFADEAEQ